MTSAGIGKRRHQPAHPDQGRALLPSSLWTPPGSCGFLTCKTTWERHLDLFLTIRHPGEQRLLALFCCSTASLGRTVLQGEGEVLTWSCFSESARKCPKTNFCSTFCFSQTSLKSYVVLENHKRKNDRMFCFIPLADGIDPFADISLGTLCATCSIQHLPSGDARNS